MIRFEYIDHHSSWLDRVIELGDQNSKTLGHFPREAFKEQAKRKWILIAFQKGELLGYLMFRFIQKSQSVSITHLCVHEDWRGKQIANHLIDQLREKFVGKCSGIRLSCRKDYASASRFWTKYGFIPKGEKPSRSIKGNHSLVLWWFPLPHISLFSVPQEIDRTLAVLDINVIIKLRETRDHEFHSLFASWLDSEVEYCFVPETYHEILRDEDSSRAEQTRAYLKNFRELRLPDKLGIDITDKLLQLLPGDRKNDVSDRNQLAQTIESGIQFFITIDERLLNSKEELFNSFDLIVCRPSEFILEFHSEAHDWEYRPGRLAGADYDAKKIKRADFDNLLKVFLHYSEEERKSSFRDRLSTTFSKIENSRSLLVTRNNKMLAFFVGTLLDTELSIEFLRVLPLSLSETLFTQLVSQIVNIAVEEDKKAIVIREFHLEKRFENILSSFHFVEHDGSWVKIVLKGIFQSSNIGSVLSDHDSFLAEYFSNESDISFFQLERALFPAKFSDLDIPCIVIPIKPIWAKHLFEHYLANEQLWGAKPELSWNKENVYYRSKNPNREKAPSRILWYISDDKKSSRSMAITACSYLDEIYTGNPKHLFKMFKRLGIYEWENVLGVAKKNIEKEIKAIKFSETEVFERIIPLKQVRSIIGKPKETFQGPTTISKEAFFKIYRLGKNVK